MRVAGDAIEGTQMTSVMSGDTNSFVTCLELLFEGRILVASCVFTRVVAAGLSSINKFSLHVFAPVYHVQKVFNMLTN